MRKRLAHSIVRRYPEPWRERYEDELLAFTEDFPPPLRDVIDLARGCVVERARALVEPAERPGVLRAGVVAMQLAVPVSLFIVAWAIGTGSRAALGPLPDALTSVVLAAYVATLGVGFRLSFGVQREAAHDASPWNLHQPYPRAYVATLVLVGALVCWSQVLSSWSTFSLFVVWFFRSTGWLGLPGADMMGGLGRLDDVRYQLAWARMELKRCETLASQGIVTTDLDRARAEMARLERERQDVLQELRAMGYRARFKTGGAGSQDPASTI
jgi:hypothetical protein